MEENKTVFFRGEFTYTRENLRTYQLANMYLDKYGVFVYTVCLVTLLMFIYSLGATDLSAYGILFVAVFFTARVVSAFGSTEYNRVISQNEGVPLQQIYEFNNYRIQLTNPLLGNRYTFHYDQVSRIGQTKDLYIIFLQHRQCLLLEKNTITKDAGDDFIRFMCAACPGMKPKKVFNGLFGKIVIAALIATLCFTLVRSTVIYFL